MSNALGGILLAAATQPSGGEPLAGSMLALLAVGICTLAAWTFVRILRPEKSLLRHTPGRPNRLHVLHILAVYLISMIAASLVQSAVAAASGIEIKPKTDLPMTVSLPASAFGLLVLIGATVAVAATTFRGGLARGLGLSGRHWLSDIGRAVVGFLAVLPLCYTALKLAHWLIPSGLVHIHPFLEFVQQASPAWVGVVIIVAAVLAPIAEELFFRGLLQSILRRYLGGPWPAVLVASAVFAAAHYQQPQDILAIFLLGVALGYNYERTGRLLGPILLHALFNAAMLWQTLA